MRSSKVFAGILPAIALAACLNQDTVSSPVSPDAVTMVTSRGALLARELCGTCHGSSFQGGSVESASCPALSVVRNYTLAEFDALLATGAERDGGTTNGYMAVTRSLPPSDRAALHEYLKQYYDQ